MRNASNEQGEVFRTWEQKGKSATLFLAPQLQKLRASPIECGSEVSVGFEN